MTGLSWRLSEGSAKCLKGLSKIVVTRFPALCRVPDYAEETDMDSPERVMGMLRPSWAYINVRVTSRRVAAEALN
jgi:hypothetical protein